MTTHLFRLALAAIVTITALLGGAPAGSDAADAALDVTVTTAMTGLHNPRGITFAPDGTLYVAEAGCGGATTNALGQECAAAAPDAACAPRPTGEPGVVCVGLTGSISRRPPGGPQQRVAAGFPSVAVGRAGVSALGPHDVSGKQTPSKYHLSTVIGLRADPTLRAATDRGAVWAQVGPWFAQLAELRPDLLSEGAGVATFKPDWLIADLGTYEATQDPGGGGLDTNPYGLLTLRDASLVVDAGANALLRVGEDGAIATLAVFPSRAQGRSRDAVPTAVAAGPDGVYYVGELTGFPAVAKLANIYRVLPGEPLLQACVTAADCLTGFTWIIDLAFDPAGNLYVLQYADDTAAPTTGILKRVKRADLDRCRDPMTPPGECTADKVAEAVYGGSAVPRPGQPVLTQPTSVAVGPDGAVYVSNRGTSPTNGEVLKIALPTN
jgi:hypothetical protein